MHIIEIEALYNGAHNQQNGFRGDVPPDGWAIIPDDMELPKTFPFVDLTAEEETRTRVRTNYSPEDQNTTEEYTVMVVSSMTEGVVPDPEPAPDPAPTQLDRVEAQATYTAMMTDTLLEE